MFPGNTERRIMMVLLQADHALRAARTGMVQDQEWYHTRSADYHGGDVVRYRYRANKTREGNLELSRLHSQAELAHRQAIAAHHAAVVGMGLRPRFGHFEG